MDTHGYPRLILGSDQDRRGAGWVSVRDKFGVNLVVDRFGCQIGVNLGFG